MRLRVSNFSCIKDAELQFGTVTVLIGPQASGKSVLCKLAYFCLDVLRYTPDVAGADVSFEAFRLSTKKKFYEWFPLSAWGSGQFVIEFRVGDLELRFSRNIYKNAITENIRIWASEAMHDHLKEAAEFLSTLDQKSKNPEEIRFERTWQIVEFLNKSIAKKMQPDAVNNQIFVPAGRSFFTSVGKAVAAFEHGRILDPLTLTFGRMYAQLRDHRNFYLSRFTANDRKIVALFTEIFGGELKDERGSEYVLTEDGRKIPISALSSGQQELLPLITVLPFFRVSRDNKTKALVYIEEPEAHLFPRAQSKLIEALSSVVNYSNSSLKMVLTTHSPYVLSKYNNLIKAGHLARRFKDRDQYKSSKALLDRVISPAAQVGEDHVRAYAIVDGHLKAIVGSDGLIDADYLDDVSGDISSEFSELLNLEYPPQ